MLSAGKYGWMFAEMQTSEQKLHDIRRPIREERKPSGKNRDKVKAARKQRRKSK